MRSLLRGLARDRASVRWKQAVSTEVSSSQRNVLVLPSNAPARDFYLGDVHGSPGLVEALLAAAGVDLAAGDRVIAAGDLIDRGRDSGGALDLLDVPGFHSVLGNHDDLMLRGDLERWYGIGGAGVWWWTSPRYRRHHWLERVAALPTMIEVAGPQPVRVVHAEDPFGEQGVLPGVLDDAARDTALWGGAGLLETRRWLKSCRHQAVAPRAIGPQSSQGWTVCGHEALGALVGPRGLGGCAPLVVGNTVYLDTGAGCEHGALSLANLDEPLIRNTSSCATLCCSLFVRSIFFL